MFSKWQAITLWKRVLIALFFGAVVGLSAHYGGFSGVITTWIKPFGQAFVNLIKMLIVPLIIVTLVSGVVAMGDPKRLGSLGVKTILLYMGTTLFAVSLGLIFGTIFQPGIGVEFTGCLLYTSPSPRDGLLSRMPSSA